MSAPLNCPSNCSTASRAAMSRWLFTSSSSNSYVCSGPPASQASAARRRSPPLSRPNGVAICRASSPALAKTWRKRPSSTVPSSLRSTCSILCSGRRFERAGRSGECVRYAGRCRWRAPVARLSPSAGLIFRNRSARSPRLASGRAG